VCVCECACLCMRMCERVSQSLCEFMCVCARMRVRVWLCLLLCVDEGDLFCGGAHDRLWEF